MRTLGRLKDSLKGRPWSLSLGLVAGAISLGLGDWARAQERSWRITVNSPLDGPVVADEGLTLREAILLAEGKLALEDLSPEEQAQVTSSAAGDGPWIGFDLPPDQTTIYLVDLLPPLTQPGLVIDGSSQPGYGSPWRAFSRIPIPVVSLTPAPGVEVFRGLTLAGSQITIQGLSLYGFWASPRNTLTTPPADIFIAAVPPPADAGPTVPQVETFDLETDTLAPVGIRLRHNWLGVAPSGEPPEQLSAFGVVVFNGRQVQVIENRIQAHEGSGVITGFRAEGLQVVGNAIVGNGTAGMPDAIRLEGRIDGTTIADNLICGNDGSGIYLFRPEGSVQIDRNDIRFNGRRFVRAAIYLMGSGHRVEDNFIGHQPGPGVAIAAHPLSEQNLIRDNRYADLQGLSVDLLHRRGSEVQDLQRGDGPNPPRDSHHRRWDTANGAINAPQFDGYRFSGTLTGQADPGSEVDLYWVVEPGDHLELYGPLAERLARVPVDEAGRFRFDGPRDRAGWVSAIATDPQYGTSEPSPVVEVLGPDGQPPPPLAPLPYLAQCLVEPPPEPEPPVPPPIPVIPDAPPPPPPPTPIRLRLQRNIHFALDRSDISPASARILDNIAAILREYPFLTVELHGHTDPRASAAYNQALSERRARAARDYLVRRGIAAERMRIVPFGLTRRRTQGTSRLDFARDRRVEFIFTDTRGLEIILEDQETDLQLE